MAKNVVFVLGTGRSGSSALTRMLSLCGCKLPPSVFGPRDLNPRGFWEPVEGAILNYRFLDRHREITDPATCLEESTAVKNGERQALIRDIRRFLRACPSEPALVLKCPGVSELWPFWLKAAEAEGLSVHVVLIVRRPQEVIASWKAAGWNAPVELMNTVWLTEYLPSEKHSRNFPRIIVEHANFISDWRREVLRIVNALSISLQPQEADVDAFLTPTLYRSKEGGPIVETFADPWISRMYSALSAVLSS